MYKCDILDGLHGSYTWYTWLADIIHLLGLVLQAAFSPFIGDVSQGLNINIFNAFHKYWPLVDQSKFSSALDSDEIAGVFASWAEEEVNQALSLLKKAHPCNDYKELQLTVIFLGDIPEGQQYLPFMAHGVLHQVDWISQAIYSIKMCLC